MAERMVSLAREQKGFRSIEGDRDAQGFGITISYWDSLEGFSAWKLNAQHIEAQKMGRSDWYSSFTTRICKLEREYGFNNRLVEQHDD